MKTTSFVCTVLSILCWSIVGIATSPSGIFKLTIMHTNDLHSRFDEVTASGSKCSPKAQCYGGVARIKTAVQDIRNTHANTIFLNAGDFFQGTLWYSLLKWSVVSNMTRSLGYTASSLGNHEFDDGVADLVNFANEVTPIYPLLACNLDFSMEPSLKSLIEPYRIFQIGSRSVGVIGYLTPETKDLASTGKVTFYDEVEKIQEQVRILQSKGVDILIAVGHSGYDVDQEIARKVDGIDIVVGGHTNSFLWSESSWAEVGGIPAGPYPTKIVQKSGRTVLVVQTNGYGLYLGRMTVNFDNNGEQIGYNGTPLLLDKSIAKDPELDNMVAHYRELIDSQMTNVVGYTSSYIDGGRPLCRLEECSFGNFMTDAMAAEMKVDIAVGNSGSIKGSFNQGNITLADIYTVVPYANNIDVVTMRGSTLKSMLEHSVSDYDPYHPDPRGWFLQVSGIIVTYDIRRAVGQRVVKLYKGKPDVRDSWHEVMDQETYDVALPSYLAYGGDRYEMIPKEKTHHKNTGFLDKDLLISYLGKNTPLKFPAPGRIIIITGHNQTSSSPDTLKKSNSAVFLMAWMVLKALECFIL